jgi:tRNA uridine 5-carboxymethylaminomethyl modification enzyme
MRYPSEYDVLVVGGGHAGCEAAAAAARLGARVLMLTMNLDRIAAMSCNPAIGGVGKGHMVREIDAMGGVMGRAADATGIQFRRLNESKGPAVRARRCQSDKARYAAWVQAHLQTIPALHIKQGMVDELLVDGGRVVGVRSRLGVEFRAKTTILTTGTFLQGLMHVGKRKTEGGRAGDASAKGLNRALTDLGLTLGRLKTGTVPRLDSRTIDLDRLELQPGDDPPLGFSFFGPGPVLPQRPCWITATTPETHQIIAENLHKSPLFSGEIEGRGPRYCPSIEDKIVRFADRESHRIFLEPEGLDTVEMYPNGISTSLPFDVQLAMVRSIPGCERAEIMRAGYAVEYTFVEPQQLSRTLAVNKVEGLYLAGQINGTTGYEEAAGQGLVAGVNAALWSQSKETYEPFELDRAESYIGVMVDDLVTRGVTEPYRMFTSRAEYRLLLREDNADERLTPRARELGLVNDVDFAKFESRWSAVDRAAEIAASTRFTPSNETNAALQAVGFDPLTVPTTLEELMKRPECDVASLRHFCPEVFAGLDDDAWFQVSVRARYDGYIRRQMKQIERHRNLEAVKIPNNLDYENITALSSEVRERLTNIRPNTVGQASRVEGVTPAAISVLLVALRK